MKDKKNQKGVQNFDDYVDFKTQNKEFENQSLLKKEREVPQKGCCGRFCDFCFCRKDESGSSSCCRNLISCLCWTILITLLVLFVGFLLVAIFFGPQIYGAYKGYKVASNLLNSATSNDTSILSAVYSAASPI